MEFQAFSQATGPIASDLPVDDRMLLRNLAIIALVEGSSMWTAILGLLTRHSILNSKQQGGWIKTVARHCELHSSKAILMQTKIASALHNSSKGTSSQDSWGFASLKLGISDSVVEVSLEGTIRLREQVPKAHGSLCSSP